MSLIYLSRLKTPTVGKEGGKGGGGISAREAVVHKAGVLVAKLKIGATCFFIKPLKTAGEKKRHTDRKTVIQVIRTVK